MNSAMKFSLAHLTVLACPPPEATYIAASVGYDFVSYRTISMGLSKEPTYDMANNKPMLRQTKKALTDTGLKAHDIELARIVDGIEVKSYEPDLEAAAQLGAKHVISSIWTSHLGYATESLIELCDLAKTFSLTVNLEFVTWAYINNLRGAIDMCRAVKRDNCGLLIDTLHFNRSHVKPEELDSVPRNWFHFVHVCDAPKEVPSTTEELIKTAREARLDLGQGGIEIAAIVNRLPEIPYSVEVPNLERVKAVGYPEHARLALENAKTYLSNHLCL